MNQPLCVGAESPAQLLERWYRDQATLESMPPWIAVPVPSGVDPDQGQQIVSSPCLGLVVSLIQTPS